MFTFENFVLHSVTKDYRNVSVVFRKKIKNLQYSWAARLSFWHRYDLSSANPSPPENTMKKVHLFKFGCFSTIVDVIKHLCFVSTIQCKTKLKFFVNYMTRILLSVRYYLPQYFKASQCSKISVKSNFIASLKWNISMLYKTYFSLSTFFMTHRLT